MAASGDDEGEGKRIRRRSGTCISDLPICLMEFIVSLLPLKDAVNTILASPRHWRHLSHSILKRPNLEISQFIWGRRRRHGLARRVDAYLEQYKGEKIDTLKIDFNFISPSITLKRFIQLKKWISWGIEKGVEDVHVHGSMCRAEFPHCAFDSSSTKLKRLFMTKYDLLPIGTGFGGFKLLTTLSLYDGDLDLYLLENLFSVCPVLESLTLNKCTIHGTRLRIVAGDRLTELNLLKSKVPRLLNCGADITARNLVKLEFIPSDANGDVCFSITTPILARMFFQYVMYTKDAFSPLIQLASCAGLKTLHLQMKSDMPRGMVIPTLANLKQLRVDVEQIIRDKYFKDNNDVISVIDLLEAAPALENLVISLYITSYPVSESRLVPQKRMMIKNDNLKTVEMYGFRSNWYETELAVGILETSPKLERMVIDTNNIVNIYVGDGKFEPRLTTQPKHDYKADVVVAQEKLKKNIMSDAHIIYL